MKNHNFIIKTGNYHAGRVLSDNPRPAFWIRPLRRGAYSGQIFCIHHYKGLAPALLHITSFLIGDILLIQQ